MYLLKQLKQEKVLVIDIICVLILGLAIFNYYVNQKGKPFVSLGQQTISDAWVAEKSENGNLYVVDQNRSRILVINAHNEIINEIEGFSYIDDFQVDAKGDLYIIDTTWKKNSFMVESDTLYYYHAADDKKKPIFVREYEDATKHQMFGAKIINGSINVLCLEKDAVQQFEISADAAQLVKEYPFKNAVDMLQDLDIAEATGEIYAIDKRGSILRFGEEGAIDKVFSFQKIRNIHTDIALYRMDVTKDGVVYATDIVSNKLMKIEDGAYRYIYSAQSGLWNVKVSQTPAEETVIVGDGNASVLDEEGSVLQNTDVLTLSKVRRIARIVGNIISIMAVISICIMLLRLILVILGKKATGVQKISRFVMLAVAIVTIVIISQLFSNFKSILRDEKLSKLEFVANNISRSMDALDVNNITTPTDYMNGSYINILDAMGQSLDYSYDSSLYCNLIKYHEKSDQVYDIVFFDSSIGAYYPLFGQEADEVRQVYKTGKTIYSDAITENGGFVYVKVPVKDEKENVVAVVEVGTWSDSVTDQILEIEKKMMLQLAVWLVMILYIFSEITEFAKMKSESEKESGTTSEIPLYMNRLVVFLIFFAYNMPTAFLPVYVAKMYQGNWPLPIGIAQSLPISVNTILLGSAALVGYQLINHFSFKKAMFISVGAAIIGDFVLAIADNYELVLLGLVLNGIGVGLQMNLLHTITTYLAEKKKNNTIYTIYQSGSLSGIMVGMAVGSILAGFIGYQRVFFVTLCIWIIIFIIMFTIKGEILVNNPVDVKEKDKQSGRKKGMLAFILQRRVLLFLVCVLFLYAITSSFVYYYVPMFCDSKGYGSDIACLFMIISSVCGIYFSATTTRYFTKRFGKWAILVSSLITCFAMMLFTLLPSSNILVLSLLLIGFSSSFGAAVRLATFSGLKEVAEYGADRATGVYDLVERAGEAAGPLVFASLYAGNSVSGMAKFVVISIVACLAYMIILSFSGKNKRMKEKK